MRHHSSQNGKAISQSKAIKAREKKSMETILFSRIFFQKIFLRKVQIKQFGIPKSSFQHRIHSRKLSFFHWLQQGSFKSRRYHSPPGITQLRLGDEAEGRINHWTAHALLPEKQGSWPCKAQPERREKRSNQHTHPYVLLRASLSKPEENLREVEWEENPCRKIWLKCVQNQSHRVKKEENSRQLLVW